MTKEPIQSEVRKIASTTAGWTLFLLCSFGESGVHSIFPAEIRHDLGTRQDPCKCVFPSANSRGVAIFSSRVADLRGQAVSYDGRNTTAGITTTQRRTMARPPALLHARGLDEIRFFWR